MNVAYLGPLLDYSGYGEANRHAVAALQAAGANVAAQLVRYTEDRPDFGQIGALMAELLENKPDYRIKILHTTPDQYVRHMEEGKFHIGHFFWETSIVPEAYAEGLRKMDEIWTGSQANLEAIQAANVDVPVRVIPQAIETERAWPAGFELAGHEQRPYTFYSIFEWTERKNPEALLRAYWQEFKLEEPVALVIKTYFRNFNAENKRRIRHAALKIKQELGLRQAPPVYLHLDLMDRQQIMRLHKTGDCFVSAHRGEGWGVPQVEAALAGRPVISTGYGGAHEYFEHGNDMVLVPYELVSVRGMEHARRLYSSPQLWADVDETAMRGAMRWAYSDPTASAAMGARARQTVLQELNLAKVGNLMLDRLKAIEEAL